VGEVKAEHHSGQGAAGSDRRSVFSSLHFSHRPIQFSALSNRIHEKGDGIVPQMETWQVSANLPGLGGP